MSALDGYDPHLSTAATTEAMQGSLRAQLVSIALEWERTFGNAPSITTVLSEYDAAMLVGLSESEYSVCISRPTAVQKGYDFVHQGRRYQVKGNRPSGKRGSLVTWVPKGHQLRLGLSRLGALRPGLRYPRGLAVGR